MKYVMKKLFAYILIGAFLLQAIVPGIEAAAASSTAITIKLLKKEGSNIKITNASGKSISVKDGMRIYNGYTIETKKKSYVYLSLDNSKAVKLDQNTKVKIVKKGSKNEISLVNGELFFNVSQKLKSNEKMTVKTSNISMGIRGTSGAMGVRAELNEEGEIVGNTHFVQMYDGSGEISYKESGVYGTKTISLPAGNQMAAGVGTSVSTAALDIMSMPSFAVSELLADDSLYERFKNDTGIEKNTLQEKLEDIKQAEEERENKLQEYVDKKIEELKQNNSPSYNASTNITSESNNGSGTVTDPENGNNSGSNGSGGGDNNIEKPSYETTLTIVGKLRKEILNQAFYAYDIVNLEGTSIINTDDIIVPTNKALVINAGSTFTNNGEIEVRGALINKSSNFNNKDEIEIIAKGTMENLGVVENSGELEVEGNLVNSASGTILNLDSGKIQVEGNIENFGKIINLGTYTCTGTSSGNAVNPGYKVYFYDWNGILLGKVQYVERGSSATDPSNLLTGGNFIGWDKDFSNITGELHVRPAVGTETICMTDENVYLGMSLDDAIILANTAASQGITIKLNDLNGTNSLTSASRLSFNGSNVTLDLNNMQLTVPEIINMKELTIKNGDIAITTIADGTAQRGIYNGDKLNLSDLNLHISVSDNSGTPYTYSGIISRGTKLTIDNSKVIVNGADVVNSKLYAVEVAGNLFVTEGINSEITASTLSQANMDTAQTVAVYLKENARYELKEGHISGENHSVLIIDGSEFHMNGGKVKNTLKTVWPTLTTSCVKALDNGKIYIKGGEINVQNPQEYGLETEVGQINMTGGKISLESNFTTGIYSSSSTSTKSTIDLGDMEITGGLMTKRDSVNGIHSDGIINMNGGSIELYGENSRGVSFMDGATMNLTAGTILVKVDASTDLSYCIYADSSASATLYKNGGKLISYAGLNVVEGTTIIPSGSGTTEEINP